MPLSPKIKLIAVAINAAKMPYSIAVAPFSLPNNERNFNSIIAIPCLYFTAFVFLSIILS